MDCFDNIKEKDLKSLEDYLKLGSINAKNELGQSLLDYAIIYDFEEAFDLLVKNYIDLNSVDNDGNTALMYSINYNKIGYFKRLVREKCNLNIVNNKGESAIMIALNKNHLEMAKILFDSNVDLSFKNKNDENIYFSIIRSHNLDLLSDMLQGNEKYINSKNFTKRGLLHQAVIVSDYKIAFYLLNSGICANVADNFGETPIFFAIRNKDLDMIRLLVGHGALLNKRNNFYETPYEIADKNVKAFLDYQINGVKYLRYQKKYPLHTAVELNDFLKVRQYTTVYNLTKRDEYGFTPLEYAEKLDYIEIYNYLRQYDSKKYRN